MDVGRTAPAFDGLAKFDLEAPAGKDACVGRIQLQEGRFTGACGDKDIDDASFVLLAAGRRKVLGGMMQIPKGVSIALSER